MKEVNQTIDCDVLIVGGGLAGCLAAVAAKETLGADSRVVIVDKSKISRSGQSTFAAGIFTAFDPEEDDLQQWMEEIVHAGEYLNDQLWCKQLFDNQLRVANSIDGWGTSYGKTVFLRDENGRFKRRRSRGHIHTRHNMINSLPMMETMRRKMAQEGVNILDRVMVTDLVGDECGVQGALGFGYRDADTYLFKSKTTIVAASGCCFRSVYIGHRNLTGDLQAAAVDVGARFVGMEQFYSNTVAKNYDIHGLNLYVGVGGKFLNGLGEEFMWQYNPILGSRARLQDLVISFCREVEEGRGPIYLDATSASQADRALCRAILPETFKVWDRAGIVPFEQKVEWIPAFRGTAGAGGGLKVNLKCETNVPRLYAAGDICWMGPQGVYTFGGINISYTGVSGDLAGRHAAAFAQADRGPGEISRARLKEILQRRLSPVSNLHGYSSEEVVSQIQSAIIPYRVAYLKTPAAIAEAQQRLEEIEAEMIPQLTANSAHELVKANEARSMVKVGKMMLAASLAREESRGFHHRIDFPLTDNEKWLKWVIVKRNERGGIDVTTEPVDPVFVKPKESKSLPPGTPIAGKERAT
ncbi:MAG: FAD-dependent oxidoreductase [Chloroflexi bacterium]|nr:FAD-dependent oxidoreductase [Chloroflexota bacterium]